MSIFRIAAEHLRVGVLNELQYRVNFFVQLLQSVIALVTGFVALSLVFRQTSSLAGWSAPELLVVMGVHILVGGLIQTLIQPNMARLIADVQQGTLDYVLTKPADAQALVSMREFRIWRSIDVIIGSIVVLWALANLSVDVGFGGALAFGYAIVLGGLMVYSVWLALTTSSFWVIRSNEMLEMFNSVYQAGRWPVGVYPGWLRGLLIFIVPVAFAVTVPSQALTDRLGSGALVFATILTVAMLAAGRFIWRRGLRRYSGASA